MCSTWFIMMHVSGYISSKSHISADILSWIIPYYCPFAASTVQITAQIYSDIVDNPLVGHVGAPRKTVTLPLSLIRNFLLDVLVFWCLVPLYNFTRLYLDEPVRITRKIYNSATDVLLVNCFSKCVCTEIKFTRAHSSQEEMSNINGK